MRNDFAVFILTHGRPDRQRTRRTLELSGYTGKVYLVIDDEDPAGDAYRRMYGSQVITFSKTEAAEITDVGDADPDHRGVVYARNALWKIAEDLGLRYFIVLDDDYTNFSYRMVGAKAAGEEPDFYGWTIRRLDAVLTSMLRFLRTTETDSIAMSQGGDLIGGKYSTNANVRLKRKVMNSFICDVRRPFAYMGRINEDVSAYVAHGRTGRLFFTYTPVQLTQLPTQQNPGGLTEQYLDSGTYVKSFYSVLYAPSCTTVVMQQSTLNHRLHHRINWDHAVPKILHAHHKRTPDPKDTR